MEFNDRNEEEEEKDDDNELSQSIPASSKNRPAPESKYMECLKNHAARIGGHAIDGCREFMPAGPQGSIEALICDACNCHRNFHRKVESVVVDPTPDHQRIQFPSISCCNNNSNTKYQEGPRVGALLRFYPYGGCEYERKRFRTKFTLEQKERMRELAEKVGWRLSKEDDVVVRRFTLETGISRRVLKVWMHNHKHTLGNKLIPS